MPLAATVGARKWQCGGHGGTKTITAVCAPMRVTAVNGECTCTGQEDQDGDGIVDCHDKCPADPNKVDAGQCGCGVSDEDTDGDGTADCNDKCKDDVAKVGPGACGCNKIDYDSDADGTMD